MPHDSGHGHAGLAHKAVAASLTSAAGACLPARLQGAHEIILDMVAFRDPHSVPVAAFYGDPDLKVNFCGKLAADGAAQVGDARARCFASRAGYSQGGSAGPPPPASAHPCDPSRRPALPSWDLLSDWLQHTPAPPLPSRRSAWPSWDLLSDWLQHTPAPPLPLPSRRSAWPSWTCCRTGCSACPSAWTTRGACCRTC
jgi:hypothetical protein